MFKAVRFCLSVCLPVCLSACLSAHVVILYDDLLLSMTSCRLSTVVKVSCKKENDTFAKYSLPPATELQEGNVFTPVCHSVHRGGTSLSRWVSVQGFGLIRVQGGQSPGGSLSGRPLGTVTCGRYASYWNAFLLHLVSFFVLNYTFVCSSMLKSI